MKIEKTRIEGPLIISPDVFGDSRGYFFESFNQEKYSTIGIPNKFVQDNISKSVYGTVRGLHFQSGKYAQGKLCQVLQGKVLDVAVDIRIDSPTFGEVVTVELSDEKKNQFWIPPGFAHGFSVLSENVLFHYKCTTLFNKESERSIYYADTQLKIDWKVKNPIVSDKDLDAPTFKEFKKNI